MNATETSPLESLYCERDRLRASLAHALEMRQPLDDVKRIENRIRELWARIESLERAAP